MVANVFKVDEITPHDHNQSVLIGSSFDVLRRDPALWTCASYVSPRCSPDQLLSFKYDLVSNGSVQFNVAGHSPMTSFGCER